MMTVVVNCIMLHCLVGALAFALTVDFVNYSRSSMQLMML